MSVFIDGRNQEVVQKAVANLAQAAGEYTLKIAAGDVFIKNIAIYVNTAGSGFVSASIYTNHVPALTILTVGDGALANLTAGKQLSLTGGQQKDIFLPSGGKIFYSINGATGTVGTLHVIIHYLALDQNAYLA